MLAWHRTASIHLRVEGKILKSRETATRPPGTIWQVTSNHIIVVIYHAKPQASKGSQPTGQIQKTQAGSDNTNTTSRRLLAPRACTRRTQSPLAPKRTVISSPLLLAPIRPASLNNNNSQQQQQPDPANNNNQPEAIDDFESFYLQQVTAEFADDLDKLRNASDFTDKSMPVLVEALKDTARTYSEEEKREVMGRGR